MYHVAICYTKQGKFVNNLLNNFCLGLIKNNDTFIKIRTIEDVSKIKNVDIVIQFCGILKKDNISFDNILRWKVAEKIKQLNCRWIQIDRGFLRDKEYLSIGFEGHKNIGKYYNNFSPADRWNKLNVKLKSWRKSGNFILLIGQTRSGQSCSWINLKSFYKETIIQIKKNTQRPIIFKPHPKADTIYVQDYITQRGVAYTNKKTLIESIQNCWAVVTWNSNAGFDSIILGVPCFALDKSFIGYNIANHNLENLDNPILFKREQTCYDIAYTQWSIEEMKNGICWKYLRKFIKNEN